MKMVTVIQCSNKDFPQKIGFAIFDGVVTSSFFKVTSYHPVFFRKRTSTEPIHVKISTIVHFDNKNSKK